MTSIFIVHKVQRSRYLSYLYASPFSPNLATSRSHALRFRNRFLRKKKSNKHDYALGRGYTGDIDFSSADVCLLIKTRQGTPLLCHYLCQP